MLSLVAGLVLAASVVFAATPDTSAATISATAKKSFISSVVSAAQNAQRNFGVPASVLIAQAIVDSDWGTSSVAKSAKNYFDTPCSASMTASQFASLADAQVGKPYVLGAEAAISNTDPPKFDCSELVEWLFGRSGNKITDLAAAQYDVTKRVTGSPAVGDLVFLRNNPARHNGIGHVAVLTAKLSNGDWRIIEARGRASGVVRTTLSYWKQRSYYAGLRRYAKFALAGSGSVEASAAGIYQAGCTTISGDSYAKFGSVSDSFAGQAIAIAQDAKYSAARAAMGNLPSFLAALAKAEQPKTASSYAAKLADAIADYGLQQYNVVPFSLVLESGASGAKVTATQYLLGAAGHTVPTTGKYDSATIAAVKRFQKAKGLYVDGEAGPKTLGALGGNLTDGAKGPAVSALNTLLKAAGQRIDSGTTFTATTTAAVKSFQTVAGRPATGNVDDPTWAALFMTLKPGSVKVTGKAAVGETLTADAGTWSPGSVSLSYRWFRGDIAISGATGKTYAVTVADAGAPLSVQVTGAKRLYTTTFARSIATATVPLLVFSASPTPKVAGEPKVGSTLTATAGSWAPGPVTLGYQWFRAGKAISQATATTYQVTPADAGSTLTVAVTGNRTGYRAVTKASAATAAVPRTLTAATPTIIGAVKVRSTLSATAGQWGPSGVKLSYQWYRSGVAIPGATTSKLLVHSTELNATLTVKVTGTLAGFTTTSRTSVATAKVAPGDLLTKTPTVTGTRKSGSTLKVNGGDWGPGTVKLTYQWYRGSTKISGATSTSYKLTSKDKGAKITVAVRGTRVAYVTAEKRVTVTIAR